MPSAVSQAGLIDLAFPEFAEHFSDTYGKAPLAVLKHAPTAKDLLAVPVKKLTELLRKNSGGHHTETIAKKLRAAAVKVSLCPREARHCVRASFQ